MAIQTASSDRSFVSKGVWLGAGEVMMGDLARAGFDITDEQGEADVIVINTCAFVEDAKTESLEVCNLFVG